MKRQWLATGMTIVALSSVLSACGGSDDEPKAAATKATSTAPATTTPPPAPAVPVQPAGANGVTYEIQNWDQYATDPAVLAWKQTMEAVAASVNQDEVLDPMRDGMSKSALRVYVKSIQQAWKGDWHVEAVGHAKLESAATTGSRAELVACTWAPTTAFIQKDGKPVGGETAEDVAVWQKQRIDMAFRDGRWIIAKFEYDGDCSGAAPA